MSVKTNESQAHELLKTMSAKPASYRLAFYGVVNKLCGTQKKISSTKQRFLKASEELATNG